MEPLTDDQIYGSEAMGQVKEPACPLATAAGGCPPDCTFCDDWPAAHIDHGEPATIINHQ